MKQSLISQSKIPTIANLVEQQVDDHFQSERSTSNTARTVWRCAEHNPCRRTDCDSCMERRRQYYVCMGARHARSLGLDKHVTLSWLLGPGEIAWERLVTMSSMIPKRLTGRIGPFMRVLAIGDADTPHVHYLIRSEFEHRFILLAREHSPNQARTRIGCPKEIYDMEGILDYFFVKNFAPTAIDPRKVKGTRLLSGTRGDLTYGYPRSQHWNRYEDLLSGKYPYE